MFGGSGAYSVHADFINAGQLVKSDQVEVGGRPVGSITNISLTANGLARVDMKLDEFTPLHEGTTATIRATSLSGIANRYVSLDLGPDSAGKIPDGGQIQAERTTAPVDLDQLFDTLDPATLAALHKVTFEHFVSDTAKTVSAIAARRGDLASLVGNADQTAAAIGDENVALGQALGLLPTSLRKANTTFVNLRSTLDDLDPLVAASKP